MHRRYVQVRAVIRLYVNLVSRLHTHWEVIVEVM